MSLVEKLASINTKLKSVLSDINTALVSKGATAVATLDDVSTAIQSVSGGSGGSEPNSPPWVDTSTITDFQYYGYGGNRDEMVKNTDFTHEGITDYTNAFYNCETIEELTLNVGSVKKSASRWLFGCSNLTRLVLVGIPPINSFLNSTSAPAGLTDLVIDSGWNVTMYLKCNNITQESLHAIIENLADLTGLDAVDFTVGSTALAKIDEEHIAMLENKNWNYT